MGDLPGASREVLEVKLGSKIYFIVIVVTIKQFGVCSSQIKQKVFLDFGTLGDISGASMEVSEVKLGSKIFFIVTVVTIKQFELCSCQI